MAETPPAAGEGAGEGLPPMIQEALDHFAYDTYPEPVHPVCQLYQDLANALVDAVPPSGQLDLRIALERLLESRSAALRAQGVT